MNTELEHLKYQIIAWVVALNDAQVLAQVAQTLQNAPESEPPQKLRQFGSMKGLVLYMADDFNEPLEEFKEYMP
ncbi:MAG: DUF2281 domain-containing protein [Bernardetiaceae bacterium]|nr:DUF2281 domain-containing protein [Bernardetiaceae bacterium]